MQENVQKPSSGICFCMCGATFFMFSSRANVLTLVGALEVNVCGVIALGDLDFSLVE